MNKEQLGTVISTLEKLRNQFGETRKMQTQYGDSNGHCEDLDTLTNRNDFTASQFFHAFVRTANEDHGINPLQARVS